MISTQDGIAEDNAILFLPNSAVQMGMAGYMISMNTLDGVRILVYLAAEEALATDRAASAPNIKTLLDTNRKFSQKKFKMN